MINTAIEGDKLVVHDTTRGWKIRVLNETKYGISPLLAFRQAKYLLENLDEYARSSAEGFNNVLESVKKMWADEKFTLLLVGFSIPQECYPTVEVEALLDGEEPPTLLHSIFVSVKETTENLDRFTIEDETVTEQAAGVYLEAMQIQDGVYGGW